MSLTKLKTPLRNSLSLCTFQRAAIALSVALSLVLLVWAGRLSRPIADDYCAAQVLAQEGIWGEVAFGWHETGGAVFQYFVYSIFPGFLMNSLDWSLAGTLPMLLPPIVLGLGFWLLSLRLGLVQAKRWWLTWWSAGLVAIGWFALWTLNGLFSSLVRAPVGASSIEDARAAWFGLTTFYLVDANVLMTLVLMVGWTYVILSNSGWLLPRLVLVIFLGGITGAAGPQYTAMFLLAVPITAITLRYATGPLGARRAVMILVALLVSALTFLITTRAPGFVDRKAASSSGLNVLGVIESISSSLYLWFTRLFSPGMLAAFAIGVCIGILLKGKHEKVMWIYGALLLVASFAGALATGLCHVFIYTAYWHDIPWTIPLYLAVVILGVLLARTWERLKSRPKIQSTNYEEGNILSLQIDLAPSESSTKCEHRAGWTTPFVCCVALLICVTSLLQVVHARNRLEIWTYGPAPQPGGVQDIDNSYFASCWTQWDRSSEIPRSLTLSMAPTTEAALR